MPEQYEVSVTIGVRQLAVGPGSFSASDTFMVEATGFTELMGIMAAMHDMAIELRARAVRPQDKRR